MSPSHEPPGEACATHTVVVSDLHVTDAQPVLPDKPLWKRYKQRDLFIDDSFERFLAALREELPEDAELVLDGDVFDFDSVMAIPEDPPFPVSWLERRRGLGAEEAKSRFKMRRILADHPVFVRALRDWVMSGRRLVLVIGNHDVELHWRGVRTELYEALDLPPERRGAVRVCAFFYLSCGDTLIEHGNQYDSYCLCDDPLFPTIRWRGTERVRVPFGNLAERFMLNGMGLFNPHVDSSFIKPPLEYLRFFFKTVLPIQPLLGWTWLWTAVVTFFTSLREGFLPAVRDPRRIEDRVAEVARDARATPATVRALHALKVHPAIFSPWRVARELWLDRALALALVVYGSFQVVTVLNVFHRVSPWWALAIFLVLLPPFLLYARSVRSTNDQTERNLLERLPVALEVTGARRVVIGHTHHEHHWLLDGAELLNTGTWSPAYEDVACTVPVGRKCFAWIRPPEGGGPREAGLWEWRDPGFARIEPTRPPGEEGVLQRVARNAGALIRKGRDG